jgi:HPt (histidine-containing phosphotransfer) domain-containing protein
MQPDDATITMRSPAPARIPAGVRVETAPVLDYDGLLASADGDERLMHEMVSLFLVQCPRLMNRIRDAVAAEDPVNLHAGADALKGSATTIAAARVADATLVLERMGSRGHLAGATRALESLEVEVRCLELVLSIMKV